MQDLFHGEAGTIRLGAMEPTASYRLPEVLEMFMGKYPKVQVSVQIQSSEILSKMVKTEEVDFAICTAPERESGTFFDPLFFERMVLLCPASHHLAGRESVLLKDLHDEKIILTTSSCPFRRNLERNLVEKGISPVYGIEVSNMLAVKYYVQAKFGLAVVPEIVASPLPEGTVSKPIRDFSKGGTVGILRKTDAATYLGSAAKKLIGFLSETLSRERSSGKMPAIL
ncbi:LysR family transcriptional regulator substrate-binding protein [Terrilactibacillus sp. S3-3]|nr:LysR family transcriptional regulator substrate-binding protein [Terrilactibacillus sp. S3-3]